eukprot:TRINITY_DN47044_c0_g1_i1.p1 TRINITY_DN47044_c0_g1~~TRINITY_DN47044_c0_g1_i1.p1  ORF type:complete len:206 (+),score=91.62 TRINITY_DN47044_c0_g1_i1:64-681(+)
MQSSSRQIEQMKQFILSEATEKAEEIKTKAENEAYAWKNEQSKKQKDEIDRQCQKEMEQHRISKRVAHANEIKRQRDSVLNARLESMEKLKKTALQRLTKITTESSYDKLIADLTIQAIESVSGSGSTDVVVRCRKADVSKVEKSLKAVKGISAKLDSKFLDDEMVGGVYATANSGKIVCNNTLLHRLENCMDEIMPILRNGLFN